MNDRRTLSVGLNPSWRLLVLLSICLGQTQGWTTTVRKPSRNQSIHHDEQRTMRLRPWLRLPPLQKQRSTHILHATSSNDETSNIESQKQQDEEQRQQFTIRNCKFADLKAVSDIIVNSFYTDSMRSSPFAAVLKLGELNRLQQNFP